jgi:hypothetical protein
VKLYSCPVQDPIVSVQFHVRENGNTSLAKVALKTNTKSFREIGLDMSPGYNTVPAGSAMV